jgi:asparagine synthase (glutamine-hydrolysing)
MCGIAGFIAPGAAGEAALGRMLDVLAHRGPDDRGCYVDADAAIGMRRLSIIDLAGGHQPMTNEDGSLWIVYNGEIFNHAALRGELLSAGHRFASVCDTETIVHAYEESGAACVEHLRGMFAFVIWDRARRRLFGARDRLGIKPFYYFWDGRLFAFASEIKALLEHPAISARLNEAAIPAHLSFGYTSDDQTLFTGVRKLLPGHTIELDCRGDSPVLGIAPYWDPPARGSSEARPEQEWIAECRRRLEETVRMRLMSDVPLGMFLSGGVDSSAIAALASRMVSGPLQTFAVGYDEAAFSELDYARGVARALGTEHREVRLGFAEFFDLLPRLVWHEDEPLAWPSSVSLYCVSRLAARHVKVVLTGEGSDELFGGYERYRHHLWNAAWARRYGAIPAALRAGLRSAIETSAWLPGDLRRKIGHTFLGRGASVESLLFDNFYCAFSASEIETLLARCGDPYAAVLAHWNRHPDLDLLSRMLYTDQKTYLVELLMKQDQMSMACSIESRVPFLDHPLVEFAARVPDSLKIRNGEAKYILKRAVEDLLPRQIVYRKKMGFPTPLRPWLRRPEAEALFAYLREPGGLLAACVRREPLERMIAQHRAGALDGTDRLWRLLNLQVWGDLHITGRRSRLDAGLLAAPESIPQAS